MAAAAAATGEVIEIDRGEGAPLRMVLDRVGRGPDGPQLEGRCAETGAALTVPASAVRGLRHADGRTEEVSALVARRLGRLWMLHRLDRLALLVIVLVAGVTASEVQGARNLGLYAVFWAGVLYAAGGVLVWAVLRRALGLPGWGR